MSEERKTIRVVAAVIRRDDLIFATQRGYGDYKDWWEFPGGKIESGETPQDALAREIREELDADITVGEYIMTVEYDYPKFHLSMDCYWCSLKNEHMALLEHEAARWVRLDELEQVKWLPADVLVMRKITEGTVSFAVQTYGDPDADTLLVQMVDDHDLSVIDSEIAYIRELTGGKNFCLKAVRVHDWNKDLSPWPAPAVFGNEDFGDGAEATLGFLLDKVLPAQNDDAGADSAGPKKRIFIGGYSLAGLFALWAGCQTDRFAGIAAASPSVWFPGFISYLQEHMIRARAVYLSLGDREEKTRNPVMAQVGSAIREAESILKDAGKDCILEWNKGNHFKEPDLRTAKAFAWLMNRED